MRSSKHPASIAAKAIMCSWLNQARRVRRVAECAMNRLEKLFAIKRFSQKSDYADLHRSDPRSAIFVSCDHDQMGLRRYSAQPRQDFQAGHFFHPNVQHDKRHVVRRDIGNEILAVTKRTHGESI